nr:hypothetical protein [Acidithiobacillus sp. AMEEHan]
MPPAARSVNPQNRPRPGGTHGNEEKFAVGHTLGNVGTEMQSSTIDTAADDLRQVRLMDGDFTSL